MKKLILLTVLFVSACSNEGSETKKISNVNIVEDEVIIDVRTRQEYNIGHVKGAINLPHQEIITDNIDMSPYKDKKIYVYCRTTNRATLVFNYLKEDYDITVLEDGYEKCATDFACSENIVK